MNYLNTKPDKYTLKLERGDGTKIEVVFEDCFLPDILEHVESFLKAAGFQIQGSIDIVEEEELMSHEEVWKEFDEKKELEIMEKYGFIPQQDEE